MGVACLWIGLEVQLYVNDFNTHGCVDVVEEEGRGYTLWVLASLEQVFCLRVGQGFWGVVATTGTGGLR